MKEVIFDKTVENDKVVELLKAVGRLSNLSAVHTTSFFSITAKSLSFNNGSCGFYRAVAFDQLGDSIINITPNFFIRAYSVAKKEVKVTLNEENQRVTLRVDGKVSLVVQNTDKEQLNAQMEKREVLIGDSTELLKNVKLVQPFYSQDHTKTALQGIYVSKDGTMSAGTNTCLIKHKPEADVEYGFDTIFLYAQLIEPVLSFEQTYGLFQSGNFKGFYLDEDKSFYYFSADVSVKSINLLQIFDTIEGQEVIDELGLDEAIVNNLKAYFELLDVKIDENGNQMRFVVRSGATYCISTAHDGHLTVESVLIERELKQDNIFMELHALKNVLDSKLFTTIKIANKYIIFVGRTATATLIRRV